MGRRRRFTAEFKREAVKLALQPGAVVSRIAEDLGLHANVLRIADHCVVFDQQDPHRRRQ